MQAHCRGGSEPVGSGVYHFNAGVRGQRRSGLLLVRQHYVAHAQGVSGRAPGNDHCGNTNQDGELQTYATKYQICLHSCLMFENTLPIRVQYKIVASGQFEQVVRTGTLSPGEEVPIHDFQLDARLMLRLPEMDSIWSRPINLGDCIYRDGMGKAIKAMLGAFGSWDPVVEFLPSPQSPGIAFKDGDVSSNKVITELITRLQTTGVLELCCIVRSGFTTSRTSRRCCSDVPTIRMPLRWSCLSLFLSVRCHD